MKASKKNYLLVFLLAASASNSGLGESGAAINNEVEVTVTVCDRNDDPVSGIISYTMNYHNGDVGFVKKSHTIGDKGIVNIKCSKNTGIEIKPASEIYYAVVGTCQNRKLKLVVPNYYIIQSLIWNLERSLKKRDFAVASLVFSEFAASKRKGLLAGSQIDYGLSGSQTEHIGELLKSGEFDRAVASLTEFYLGRDHNLHYEAPLHKFIERPFSGAEETMGLYSILPFADAWGFASSRGGIMGFRKSYPYSATTSFLRDYSEMQILHEYPNLEADLSVTFAKYALKVEGGITFDHNQGKVVMTKKMQEEVLRYQRSQGIEETGHLDYATLSRLSATSAAKLMYSDWYPSD